MDKAEKLMLLATYKDIAATFKEDNFPLLLKLHKDLEAIKKNQYCDHDYSGGNYSICSKCGEMVR